MLQNSCLPPMIKKNRKEFFPTQNPTGLKIRDVLRNVSKSLRLPLKKFQVPDDEQRYWQGFVFGKGLCSKSLLVQLKPTHRHLYDIVAAVSFAQFLILAMQLETVFQFQHPNGQLQSYKSRKSVLVILSFLHVALAFIPEKKHCEQMLQKSLTFILHLYRSFL